MKRLILLSCLVLGLIGCGQKQSIDTLADTAYEWEKAYMDSDYERQQQLVFKKGSYTVDKDSEKEESCLKKKDVSVQLYYDSESDRYIALTDYINPQKGNQVQSEWVLREKEDSWKIDTEASRDITREHVQELECVSCEKGEQ